MAYMPLMVKALDDHPLRNWRKSQGLTLDQAARKVGTVRQVWSDWERGRRRPSSVTMAKIYRLTGGAVQPNDFYELPQSGTVKDAA